jgi:hypothetical protein
MYNKKQIEELLKITRNTLNRTLEEMGVDKAKVEFTDEELELIKKARDLVSANGNYDAVKERFQVAQEAAAPKFTAPLPHHSADNKAPFSEFSQQLGKEVLQTFEQATERAVNDAINVLPFVMLAKADEAAKRGAFGKSFDRARAALARGHRPFTVDVEEVVDGSMGLPGNGSNGQGDADRLGDEFYESPL